MPRPGHSGVLRISADVETVDGTMGTARVEIRRSADVGFRGGLAEQFGLPYVFGAGFLRRAEQHGPDTGVGNDCANFLVSGWRRSGLRMTWSNPAQLRKRLTLIAEKVTATQRVAIPADATSRGMVVHLGSHVAALWDDRDPVGTLGPEDVVVHHLGGPPELITLGKLLTSRKQDVFDVYLGPTIGPPGGSRWAAMSCLDWPRRRPWVCESCSQQRTLPSPTSKPPLATAA